MRLLTIIFLNLLTVSCAISATENKLEKQFFKNFFNESYIDIRNSEKIRVSTDHFPEHKIINKGKEHIIHESIDFTVNIGTPSVEKVLVLLKPKYPNSVDLPESILIGQYTFDPKINVSEFSGRLSLSLPGGQFLISAWVRTKKRKYYFNSETLYKRSWWEGQ